MTDERPQDPAAPDTPSEGDAVAARAESDRIARLRARSGAAEAQPPAPPAQPGAVTPAGDDAPPPRFASATPAAASAASATPAAASPASAAPAASASAAPDVPPPPAPAAVGGTTPYDQPVGASGPAGGARRARGSPGTVVAVALAVLAATATALAGLVTSHLSSVNAVEGSRSDVVGAATSGVATILSYDYRHLDSDFATADRLLTPHFRKQYDDTTAKGVRPLAAKYKAISSADVSAAGIVETGSGRAVVLVFVNQTVTNSQLTAPRLDRSRIDVTLVRSNGRWLIDKLTTL